MFSQWFLVAQLLINRFSIIRIGSGLTCFLVTCNYLALQLKDMAERLPPGAYEAESLKLVYQPNGLETNGIKYPGENGDKIDSGTSKGMQNSSELLREDSGSNGHGLATSNGTNERFDSVIRDGRDSIQSYRSSVSDCGDAKESSYQDSENGMKSRNSVVPGNASQIEAEWIEQYEPGVYITLVALRDGTRELKRVRFRYVNISSCFYLI